MENAISWFEIPTNDLKRATAFYESILNIKLEPMEIPNVMEMALFPVDEKSQFVGGSLVCYPDFYSPSKEGPLLYLNANPDLQLALDQVEQMGGQILIPKQMITEERGFMAVIVDTEGNRIALHSNQ